MSTNDPIAIGAEIEALIGRISASPSPVAAQAQQLVQLLMSYYGAGLSRLLDIIRTEPQASRAIVERLASDPFLASLFALHDVTIPANGTLIQITRPAPSQTSHGNSNRDARCELCTATVMGEHAHLVDIETRRVLCVCTVCTTAGGRYRLVPSRYLHLPSMRIEPARWDALGIPVGLVFFVVSSHLGRTVACYPGPAGATESLLALDAWPALAADHPWVQRVAADVEALLIRHVGDEYRGYIVPIDSCYELVGRIRRAWSGFGGGSGVDREVDRFFDAIVERAGRVEVPA